MLTVEYQANRIHQQKQSACKRKGIKYNLDPKWILTRLNKGCELTSIKFDRSKLPGVNVNPMTSSIDRIDPLKGYTKDNCRMVLYCVNSFKHTMNDTQLLEVAKHLVDGLTK